MSDAMRPVPDNDPGKMAWEEWKQTDDYANTRKWALHPTHVDGSLWHAYWSGYQASGAINADLLEALKRMVADFGDSAGEDMEARQVIIDAEAAIQKAEPHDD